MEIASEAYDFHYTQYAADGSKLWIYDNRSQSMGTTAATFDTAPRYALGTDVFTFDLKESTGDGRSISVNYTYNYEDISDSIKVNMVADNNGTYIKDAANNGYVKYDANNPAHAGADRYNMEVSYNYTDSDGTTVNDYKGVLDSYTTDAMKEMLEQTNVRLDAENYTYMDVRGEANLNLRDNVNVAVRAVFDTVLQESPYDEGFHIQCSGGIWDSVRIPRTPLNSVVLNLYAAGTKTYEQAQATIEYCDYAREFISDKRAMYGAYQNRLEHIDSAKAIEEENTQAAESKLRDMDMASGMVEFSKNSILQQAAQSILAQANHMPEGLLSLLG